MKQLSIIFFAATLTMSLNSCGSVARLIRGASPLEKFQCTVDEILSDSAFTASKCGIKIVSLDNGEVLYEHDSKMLLRPASNMKLLTTAAALSTLDKNFLLKTEMYSDSLGRDSVLHGNIYFKGYGDPDFKTADLAAMVAVIKSKGISTIDGNVIGDARYFDDEHWGVGWMWDDEPFGFAAFNSALSINQNCVEVSVTPGARIGDTAIVTIAPPTQFVSLKNEATTGIDTIANSLEISRNYKQRLNTITVKGIIPHNAPPQKDLISVLRPELYFLTLVKEELSRQQIAFNGKLFLDSLPSRSVFLARHSQPIDSMIVFLNKVSDNLSAENTLKILGAEQYGAPGSTENGISVVKRSLNAFAIDTTKFLMVDGSGVSHYDLLTPDIYVQLLRGMYSRKDLFDRYYTSLPNAGVDGSLETRMRTTPAQNNLHAKTGTISGVSTLTGYVRTADGELLAFSLMMQNYIGSSEPYRKAQDAIGVLMASLKRK